MPKVTQQYRDARREHILTAARRCFVRDGFHATSMQDLFAEAQLSSGAVYRYFASKDEMIIAIAEQNLRTVVAMVHEVATAEPGRSIGDVMADMLGIVRAKHAENGIGALALLVWSEALRNASLAELFTGLLAEMRADLAAIVHEHQTRGELPAGLTPDAFANLLVCVLPGYIVQLALIGESAVDTMPDAMRALWP